MDNLLKPETLKALQGIIEQASQSYLTYAALATIILAIVLYFLSVKQSGLTGLNLAAFGLMVVFVILAGAAAFYSAAQIFDTLYYAGKDQDDTVFNVGRFTRISPTKWEDNVLSRIALDGTGKYMNGLVWTYSLDREEANGKRLYLKGSDPGRENVIIEIDLNMKRIDYIENGNVHLLYNIIVP